MADLRDVDLGRGWRLANRRGLGMAEDREDVHDVITCGICAEDDQVRVRGFAPELTIAPKTRLEGPLLH